MKSWLAFRWVKSSLSVSLDRKARPLPVGANTEFASCPLWILVVTAMVLAPLRPVGAINRASTLWPSLRLAFSGNSPTVPLWGLTGRFFPGGVWQTP